MVQSGVNGILDTKLNTDYSLLRLEKNMLEHSLIIALIVLSIWYTMQEGEIFGFVRKQFSKIAKGKNYWMWNIADPIFECNVCMTPYYGSVLYVLIYGVNWQWPIVVIAAMGINAAINKLSPDK